MSEVMTSLPAALKTDILQTHLDTLQSESFDMHGKKLKSHSGMNRPSTSVVLLLECNFFNELIFKARNLLADMKVNATNLYAHRYFVHSMFPLVSLKNVLFSNRLGNYYYDLSPIPCRCNTPWLFFQHSRISCTKQSHANSPCNIHFLTSNIQED